MGNGQGWGEGAGVIHGCAGPIDHYTHVFTPSPHPLSPQAALPFYTTLVCLLDDNLYSAAVDDARDFLLKTVWGLLRVWIWVWIKGWDEG